MSSWSRRFSSDAGISWPRTRIMGKLPTLQCRSDAPASTAVLSKSLTCIRLQVAPAKTDEADCAPALVLSAAGDAGCSRLGRLEVLKPAVAIRRLAVNDVEESLLDGLGDWSRATRSDLDAID